ncbi:MAG: hypothetical protein ACREUY_09360, partial [Burkholderiales bacterium]
PFSSSSGHFFILLNLVASVASQAWIDNEQMPRQMKLTAVPFFPQRDDQFGPVELAMALNDRGENGTRTTRTQRIFAVA